MPAQGRYSAAMSQENVEIVKRATEFLERRDWQGMTDLFDPNVELYGTVGGLEEGQILRGLIEITQAFDTENEDVWDEHRLEPQEFIDAGDRVVVLLREYQRGKGSGVELVIDTATIVDVRDGRIVRMQGYMNPAEALEAAGNVEQDQREQWEAITAAGNARDFDPVADLLHPDLEFHSRFAVAEGQAVYPGIDGLRRWAQDVNVTWEDWNSEILEFRQAGIDRTVAVHRLTGRAKGSGVPLDTRIGMVVTWRDGKAWQLVSYLDPREALDAVGLSE